MKKEKNRVNLYVRRKRTVPKVASEHGVLIDKNQLWPFSLAGKMGALMGAGSIVY
jgi:hypothetical protein